MTNQLYERIYAELIHAAGFPPRPPTRALGRWLVRWQPTLYMIWNAVSDEEFVSCVEHCRMLSETSVGDD